MTDHGSQFYANASEAEEEVVGYERDGKIDDAATCRRLSDGNKWFAYKILFYDSDAELDD